MRSLTQDDRELGDKLAKLATEQLLIRAVIATDRTITNTHYRIEVIFASKVLDPTAVEKKSAFAWLEWASSAPFPKRKSDEELFHLRGFSLGETRNDFHGDLQLIVDYWVRNMTGDGPRPHEQWLVNKPFAGLISVANGQREELKGDSRALLACYGYMLGRLTAHIDTLEGCKHFTGLEDRVTVLKEVRTRLRAYVDNLQRVQIHQAID